MKIKIREVVSSGLDFQDQAMPREIDIVDGSIDLEKPVAVKGRFTRMDDIVLASLEVHYGLAACCARCLDEIHDDASVHYELDFEVLPGVEFLDIGMRIREELLLETDVHMLCREDCKGICPDCGAYLNDEPCKCGEKPCGKS